MWVGRRQGREGALKVTHAIHVQMWLRWCSDMGCSEQQFFNLISGFRQLVDCEIAKTKNTEYMIYSRGHWVYHNACRLFCFHSQVADDNNPDEEQNVPRPPILHGVFVDVRGVHPRKHDAYPSFRGRDLKQ